MEAQREAALRLFNSYHGGKMMENREQESGVRSPDASSQEIGYAALRTQRFQNGFTLIEMMVSMVMALILLAGITAVFISNNKAASAVSSRTERMSDLYLASQVMQAGLRGSVAVTSPSPAFPADLLSGGRKPAILCGAPNDKSVSLPSGYPTSFPYYPYWDAASKTLTYQDIDGNIGIFQYQRTANDRIYWLRPDPCVYKFEELIRDLDTGDPGTVNGMTVKISASNVLTITLNSAFKNENRKDKTMSLSFNVWARN